MNGLFPETLSADLYIFHDKHRERFFPRYNKVLLNALIRLGLLRSLTTIPTFETVADNNRMNNTTNVREITEYDDRIFIEEYDDRLIGINVYKKIRIKIGKIETLKFQSIEDENGFI